MAIRDKLILVDCDGVLCDWVYAFDNWMARHGYRKLHEKEYDLDKCYGIERSESKKLVRMFNESASIGFLPPFRDAIKYVRKLHEEHGFVFHCITSLSVEPDAIKLREKNLKRLFGETVFEKITSLDTGADKDEALAVYKDTGCIWVEDKIENADTGVNLGLDSYLMKHEHNKDYSGDAVVVKNWKELYDMIT
mgnify:CR=1 FL=1